MLDEPDSHLHPNNQRLLCSLLKEIAEGRGVQVLLTTHSRHVVDALSSAAKFLWVRKATVDVAGPDDDIGILLDIGALDIKERAGVPGTLAVVLTEDEITRRLNVFLQASGFDMGKTAVLPYYGATVIKNLRPLVKMIQATNSKAKIVIHRDRDFLDDDEIKTWEAEVRKLGVEPFVTSGTDLESHFVNPQYLSKGNQATPDEITAVIEAVAKDRHKRLVEHYVNGHIDVARRNGTFAKINPGGLAADAPTNLAEKPQRFRHGKTMLAGIREQFRTQFGRNLNDLVADESLAVETLSTFAKKVFRSK